MLDGPAIATLIFLVAFLAARGVLARIQRRLMRAAGSALETRHLVHWHYAQDEWRAYCERLRRELWYGCLRPAVRWAGPVLALVAGLSIALEARVALAPGVTTLLVVGFACVIGMILLGPWLREFVRLTMRRRLEYEVYLGEAGVLEVWRDGERIEAKEEHLFTAAGGAIERVEAHGVEPSEIVFSIGQPLAFGILHTEEHFLVPAGHLAEAREIAERLTPHPNASR